MRDMGDKINSKRIAQSAGCSIIPGFIGEIANATAACEIAKDIGYPVMLKASAGNDRYVLKRTLITVKFVESISFSTHYGRNIE